LAEKFSAKILTPAEMALVPANAIPYLAARFAAKEAAVKALGTGFSAGITFQDVEVRSDPLGKPHARLSQPGKAPVPANCGSRPRTSPCPTAAKTPWPWSFSKAEFSH
jgi:holo-[acyl-carrier-protein] synthase